MADVFLNGSAVSGIDIRIHERNQVPAGPAGEFVRHWIEVAIYSDAGESITLHLHAGSAAWLIRRLSEKRQELDRA